MSILHEGLIQHPLKSVPHLKKSELTKIEPQLHKIFELCKSISSEIGSGGLAVNEIPNEVWSDFTSLRKHIPAIYLKKVVQNSTVQPPTFSNDVLIVNPEMLDDSGYFVNFELCKSINDGGILLPVVRPGFYKLSGGIYTPEDDRLNWQTVESGNPRSDLAQHELLHIEGKTVLDYPQRLRYMHLGSEFLRETARLYKMKVNNLFSQLRDSGKPVLQFDFDERQRYILNLTNNNRINLPGNPKNITANLLADVCDRVMR